MRLEAEDLVSRVKRVQARIRDHVTDHMDDQPSEALSAVAAETAGDTIYAVDRIGDELLGELFQEEMGAASYVLIGEGLEEAGETFPPGIDPEDADYRIIVDPIDGTRGLMYDKRSAWVLTGVAENRGPETSLQHISVAVQTEIPTRKQYRQDVLWGIRGRGAGVEATNRLTRARVPVQLHPSRAESIEHGFAMLSRFFPGGKDVLCQVEHALTEALIGPVVPGKARLFEDQYISSGGQFYELMAGHDRFNADLRPNLEAVLDARGQALGICCHPYDVCTELIAGEMGVIITDPEGRPLDAPLDTTSPVAWVGYANRRLRARIEPVLQRQLREFGLL